MFLFSFLQAVTCVHTPIDRTTQGEGKKGSGLLSNSHFNKLVTWNLEALPQYFSLQYANLCKLYNK